VAAMTDCFDAVNTLIEQVIVDIVSSTAGKPELFAIIMKY
jgi:hypothetical protein